MTRLFRTWFVATLASIWALAIVPPEAAAADASNVVEMAKQHFLRGVSFYKEGDLDAARRRIASAAANSAAASAMPPAACHCQWGWLETAVPQLNLARRA